MLRFVVLHHDWPEQHRDLFLEQAGVLRAWRVPAGEDLPPWEAVPNHDHRLHYLDYTGPVAGDRGHVWRYDHGTLEWLTELRVRLTGQRLHGVYEFTQQPDGVWLFQVVVIS